MKTRKIISLLTAAITLALCAHGQTVAPAPVTAEPRFKSTAPGNPYFDALGQAQLANELAQAANDYATASYGYSSRSSSGSSVPPVVIQFHATDAAAVGAMEEDLAVMTHIIDRSLVRLGEDEPPSSLGVPLYYTSGGRSVRALYLDGLGPLFLVKVNFPVHAPATEPQARDKAPDSEWEIARRAVYGIEEETQWRSSTSTVPYDGARVDLLKRQLVQALKNASNMKGIKPDEYVNATVFGSPAALATESVPGMSGAASALPSGPEPKRAGPGAGAAVAWRTAYPDRSAKAIELARNALQGTVLTLRIKKADIDAAAKGTLDDKALAGKASITTYFGNGHGLTSVNSWVRSSSSSLRAR